MCACSVELWIIESWFADLPCPLYPHILMGQTGILGGRSPLSSELPLSHSEFIVSISMETSQCFDLYSEGFFNKKVPYSQF